MNDALSIIGFYFTLVGFISGLFFTRLDSWYGTVKEFDSSSRSLLSPFSERKEFEQALSQVKGLKAGTPNGSFYAVGGLTTALTLLSLLIPVEATNLNPTLYLRLPLIVTISAYWIGGLFIINEGSSLLHELERKFNDSIRG